MRISRDKHYQTLTLFFFQSIKFALGKLNCFLDRHLASHLIRTSGGSRKTSPRLIESLPRLPLNNACSLFWDGWGEKLVSTAERKAKVYENVEIDFLSPDPQQQLKNLQQQLYDNYISPHSQAMRSWLPGSRRSSWWWFMRGCQTPNATRPCPTSSLTTFRQLVGLFGHVKSRALFCLPFGSVCWCFINIGEG